MSKDFKESVSIEIISVTGGIAAGFILVSGLGLFELMPSLLILIPGMLEMNGSISSSLAGRLSAGLFLGVLKPNFQPQRIVVGSIIAGILLSLLSSLLLGMVAYMFEYIFFNRLNFDVVVVSIAASLIACPILVVTTAIFTIWFFRRGYDPNNIMGPYITTIGDVIGIVALIVASTMVLLI